MQGRSDGKQEAGEERAAVGVESLEVQGGLWGVRSIQEDKAWMDLLHRLGASMGVEGTEEAGPQGRRRVKETQEVNRTAEEVPILSNQTRFSQAKV